MKQDFRKVKKQDLYPILDLVQSKIAEVYPIENTQSTISEHYGVYSRELCFIINNSSEHNRRNSQILWDEFKKVCCGYMEVYIKEFPQHYPRDITDFFGAEVMGVYVSTERLNSLPINDDLSLARFMTKNLNLINTLIRENK